MKSRLLLSLAGLAIGFALPTFAQQKGMPDPKLSEAFATLCKKFDETFVNGDAAAAAALFTEDAVIIPHDGPPIYGRQAIQKHFEDVFRKIHFSKHLSKPEQYSPHTMGAAGSEVWSTGEWNAIFQVENGAPMQANGHFLDIDVREGDALKYKVQTYNYTGPPTPAETNASPTAGQEKRCSIQKYVSRLKG